MAQLVSYTVTDETLQHIALILKVRPEITRSYLVRELIAAEAKRCREEIRKEVA